MSFYRKFPHQNTPPSHQRFWCGNKPEFWKNTAVAAFFLLLLAFFFGEFLSGDLIMAFKDLSRYFYPLRFLMVEQVKAGHLPLWNPYIFCGYPLLATLQIGFFYPLTLVYYLLPFGLAFNYYIMLHYLLAAWFMYLLLRYYLLSRSAALFGGTAFAFSGYLLSVSNMNTTLSSVIWLPLALIFFDRLINQGTIEKKVFHGLVLSLLLVMMLLGGEPTIIYCSLIFFLAYAAVFSGSLRQFIMNATGLFLAGLLAAGICAVQLLPFFELSRLSDRLPLARFDVVSFRSFPPREIINFIFPYFFGNPAQFGGYSETLLGKVSQDWLLSPYIGIIPFLFVFFLVKRDKKVIFFLATALIALIVAFGRYTPVYSFLYHYLPGVSLIRYPVKYMFLVVFSLTIAAAFNFEGMLGLLQGRAAELGRYKRAILLLVILFFCATGASLIWSGDISSFIAKQYGGALSGTSFMLLLSLIEFNQVSAVNITAFLLVLFLLFRAAQRGQVGRSLFAGAILVLAAADLLANGASIKIAADAKTFSQMPKSYHLMSQDGRFFYSPELEQKNRIIYGESFSDALWNVKDDLCANWHIPFHRFDFYGYESVQPYALKSFYENRLKENKLSSQLEYLAMSNVRYLAATRPVRSPRLKLLRRKSGEGRTVYLYENLITYPRALFLDDKMRPDLRGQSRAAIVNYDYDSVRVETDNGKNAWLFISDSYYPGWSAYIDGKRVEIKRANNFFRIVRVPAGKHQVLFVYEPGSFKLGAGISFVSLLLVLTGLAVEFRKNGQPKMNNTKKYCIIDKGRP